MHTNRDPSLDDQADFLAVCEVAGFRAAAKRLGLSASSVSDTITRLEGQLGVPLLTRSTRSVMPTEAGRELAARIAPLLAETRAALHDVASSGSEVRGLLKLNVAGAVMVDILPRAPNILLIPGTSSVGHLRENQAAADLTLSSDSVAKLSRIGAGD